jgi:curved DNA-binding protein CbpA
MAKTLYQLLGVASTASADDIKNAYVKQAAVLRSSGAKAQFDILKQAYDVLSDRASRSRYDRQQYVVDDSAVADDPGQGFTLFSWRGGLILLTLAAIGYGAWSYHQREQLRLRLERERAEAQRVQEEQRRVAEERRLEAERARDQAQREAADDRAAARARQSARGETLYRDTLEHQRSMQRDRIEAQRERNLMVRDELERRREDAERDRIEREQRRQLESERRQVRELESTSPRRF